MRIHGVCREDVSRIVANHHYSSWLLGPNKKLPGIKHAWGLSVDEKLVGVVVYSVPASYTLCKGVCGDKYRRQVLELSRLALHTGEKNAASFLVGGSLRELGRCGDFVVVSYADCNDHVGHVGYIYQSTNWLYTGQGSAEPKWVDPRDGTVISYTRRHIDKKASRIGLNYSDLVKAPQVGKHRYVTFVGGKKFKRQARKSLRYETAPYPKGPTHRHYATA